MKEYLYVFGYEDPFELESNETTGSDFESSDAIWIEAETEDEALKIGQAYAKKFVDAEYEKEMKEYEGWSPSNYANWIEENPLERFSGLALESLPRIKIKNT